MKTKRELMGCFRQEDDARAYRERLRLSQMSGKHLHRYLAEFEARWNMSKLSGEERFDTMLETSPGLRLTYKRLIA